MFSQEHFPCELQPTLRAGMVVVFLEVSQQRGLPLEGELTKLTGLDSRVGFMLMF